MQKPAVTIMVKAARAAGDVLLRSAQRLDKLNVVEKATQDYASDVDKNAEDAAIRELTRAMPECSVLAEESGLRGRGGPLIWVIDPLDGTVNYLYGLPTWAVSIAAEVQGEAVVGVVHVPVLRETFVAVRGQGAAKKILPDIGEKLRPRDASFGQQARQQPVQDHAHGIEV